MASKQVIAETENMKAVMKEMSSKLDEIDEMLKKTKIKVEESKEVFDTPTATYFRQKVYDYIDGQKLYINNDIRPFVEVLNTLANVYEKDFEAEQQLIGYEENNKNFKKESEQNG